MLFPEVHMFRSPNGSGIGLVVSYSSGCRTAQPHQTDPEQDQPLHHSFFSTRQPLRLMRIIVDSLSLIKVNRLDTSPPPDVLHHRHHASDQVQS
jgi:hypothetical protein